MSVTHMTGAAVFDGICHLLRGPNLYPFSWTADVIKELCFEGRGPAVKAVPW